MIPRALILATATAATLAAVPAVASAQPSTVFTGDAWSATAVAGPGGGAFAPFNQDVVALAPRDGAGFAAAKTVFTTPDFEKVWGAGLNADGAGVVITLRRHKPYQRV